MKFIQMTIISTTVGKADFIFLGSKITVDSDCSHEIKRYINHLLAPWKECYDKTREPINKQRHGCAHKGHIIKAMVFPVLMYGCESWTIKMAEHRRIDAFELWSGENS